MTDLGLLVGNPILTVPEISRLIKQVADWCQPPSKNKAAWTAGNGPYDDVGMALTEACAHHGFRLSDEHRMQFGWAVAAHLPTAATASGAELVRAAPFTAIKHYVSKSPDPQALYALLWTAFLAQQEQIAQTALADSEQPTADPVERAMRLLRLPGQYCLLAHGSDGQPELSEPILGYTIAAALLAELVFAGRLSIQRASGRLTLAVTDPRTPRPRVSAYAAEVQSQVYADPPDLLRLLDGLAADAPAAIRSELVETGLASRSEKRTFGVRARALYPPTSAMDVNLLRSSITGGVASGTVEPKMPGRAGLDPHQAVLLELVRVTGLAAKRAVAWVGVELLPKRAGLAAVPASHRQQIALLLDLVEGRVTDLVIGAGF